MITMIIVYEGKTICKSCWKHRPMVGELIRMEGRLYTVKTIIHDIDAMNGNYGYDIVVEVEG